YRAARPLGARRPHRHLPRARHARAGRLLLQDPIRRGRARFLRARSHARDRRLGGRRRERAQARRRPAHPLPVSRRGARGRAPHTRHPPRRPRRRPRAPRRAQRPRLDPAGAGGCGRSAVRHQVRAVGERGVRAAGVAVTLGDELQCLPPTPQPVWDVAHDLRARLPTVDWVVACGRGPITTPLAPTAPEIDGPCFHEARAAMDSAKHERLVFAFGGFTAALEPLASYYSALYWSWT